MNTSLLQFYRCHQGKRCFVLGAGISLPEDLSFIHNSDVVISVNSSILITNWTDDRLSDHRFWLSNDSMCLKWDYFPKVLSSKCTRMYRESWAKHVKHFESEIYHYFKPRRDEDSDSPLSDTGELCSVSSVPTAIDFAIWMRCDPIILLGVDHIFDGDKTHFWHYWPKNKWPKMCGRTFDHSKTEQWGVFEKNLCSYIKLRTYANKVGCRVSNCSPVTRVTQFEIIDLDTIAKS